MQFLVFVFFLALQFINAPTAVNYPNSQSLFLMCMCPGRIPPRWKQGDTPKPSPCFGQVGGCRRRQREGPQLPDTPFSHLGLHTHRRAGTEARKHEKLTSAAATDSRAAAPSNQARVARAGVPVKRYRRPWQARN